MSAIAIAEPHNTRQMICAVDIVFASILVKLWFTLFPFCGRILFRREVKSMNMTPVISSDISSVGYENGTLYIRFNSGGMYSYSDVPYSVYQGLMSASSQGKYFHAYIKGHYSYSRIG